jgi:hypothetical protein
MPPMDFIARSPVVPLKKTVLEYLRVGCPESDVNPQFVNAPGSLPWQFTLGDEFTEVEPPCLQVILETQPDYVTETRPIGMIVPLRVILWAPMSATEEELQSYEDTLCDLFNEVWHDRELANPAEITPVAIRLTSVAAAMDPVIPLYCRYATSAFPQRFGMSGERVEVHLLLSVCCGLFVT